MTSPPCLGPSDALPPLSPSPPVQALVMLASTPTGCPLDEALMVGPKLDPDSGAVNLVPLAEAQPLASASSAPERESAAVGGPEGGGKSRLGKKAKRSASDTAAAAAAGAVSAAAAAGGRQDMVVGWAGEGSAVRMRMAAAESLGQLIKKVHGQVCEACGRK